MAGHIFFNLGDYEMAARVNEEAAGTEREYMKLARPAPNVYTLVYYMHDLHFVSRSRAEQGLFAEATAQNVAFPFRTLWGVAGGAFTMPFPQSG